MGGIVHRNNALKDKMVASNVLMGLGNDSTDTVEKRIRDLEEGGGGGGSVVRVDPLLDEGVHIANIYVNGNISELYAPEGGGGSGEVDDVTINGQSILHDHVAEIPVMTGATSQSNGAVGLVPAPSINDKNKVLLGDGTWAEVQEVGNLNDLTDVSLYSPTDGQVLRYDAANSEWVNSDESEDAVSDVQVNGVSVIDENKVAQVTSYKELTRAEYDALPDSKYADNILYCIKDSGSEKANFFSPIIYSLAEREVGVWTDGKPLYQKSFEVNNFTYESWENISNISSLNIDSFCNSYGILQRSDRIWQSFNGDFFEYGGSINYMYIVNIRYESDTKNLMYLIKKYDDFNKMVVTIQYTKTTDNPGTGTYPKMLAMFDTPIYLGGQLLYSGRVTASSRVNFYCTNKSTSTGDQTNIFTMPIDIPNGYHIEYRVSAVLNSSDSNESQLYINDVKILSGASLVGPISSSPFIGHYGSHKYSELFKFTDIPGETRYISGTSPGFNFNLRSSNSTAVCAENIMLHAYLVHD